MTYWKHANKVSVQRFGQMVFCFCRYRNISYCLSVPVMDHPEAVITSISNRIQIKHSKNLDHFRPIINMPLPQTRYIGICFIWGAIWAFVMLNDLILHLGWRMWLGRITNHCIIISRNNSNVSKTPKPSFYFFSFKTISIWQLA